MISRPLAIVLIVVGVIWLFFTVSATGSGNPTFGDVLSVAVWGLGLIGLGAAILKWG